MIHFAAAEHHPPILGARLLRLLALVAVTLGLAQAHAGSGRFRLGKAEVRYSRGGTRADARAIVDMLVSMGIVRASDEDNGWAWRLEVTREAGRRVVDLTPLTGTGTESRFDYLDWRERSCLRAMHILSHEAFPGDPIDVRCHDDPSGAHEVTVRWEQRRCRLSLYLDDLTDVEYELGGQEPEARSIAQSIHQLAVFESRGAKLVVKRSGATHIVELTVDVTLMATVRSDALAREIRARLHPLAGAWSETVFHGEPVDIWLVYQSSDHLEIDGYEILSWAKRPRYTGTP